MTDFVEGDVCAPAELAAAIEDRYLAHWDAVWDAADPADPYHPGLSDTAAGTQGVSFGGIHVTAVRWLAHRPGLPNA